MNFEAAPPILREEVKSNMKILTVSDTHPKLNIFPDVSRIVGPVEQVRRGVSPSSAHVGAYFFRRL
jgi:hypothetical protein